MTLPAFAAERRRVLHGARSALAAIDRHLLSTGRSAANSPAAVGCCRSTGQTDEQTDGHPTVTQTLLRIYYAGDVNKSMPSCSKRYCSRAHSRRPTLRVHWLQTRRTRSHSSGTAAVRQLSAVRTVRTIPLVCAGSEHEFS